MLDKLLALIGVEKRDPRPLFYSGDGPLEVRKCNLIRERMRAYSNALKIYADYARSSKKVRAYLKELKCLVEDASRIAEYEDWEREMMKEEPKSPRIPKKLKV